MRIIVVALSLLILSPESRAGWGPSGCAPVGSVRAASFSGWRSQGDWQYYFENDRLVSAFNQGTGAFHRFDPMRNAWGPPVRPSWVKPTEACKCNPCQCNPCQCKADFHFGLDIDQLHKDGKNRYSLDGRPVTRREAVAAIKLSDDSAKPYVTFIGPNREAIHKAFLETPEAQKCRVHSYDASSWELKPGFVTTGSPTIYVQNAKGEVLYRTDTAPTLEKLRGEARKAQPDYDSSKDPNGTVDPLAALKKVPFWVWILGAVSLLLIFKRKD